MGLIAWILESRSINAPIPSHLEAWSVKDLLYDFWENFSSETQWLVQRGQEGAILPVQVANHNCRIWFILPTDKACHKIYEVIHNIHYTCT